MAGSRSQDNFIDLLTAEGQQLLDQASSLVPWSEHPRPKLRRREVYSLNGNWQLTVREGSDVLYDGPIRVPFPPESILSGIHRHFPEGALLCYHRDFHLPSDELNKLIAAGKTRLLLHVDAADQTARISVNGHELLIHEGGYEHITVEIPEGLLSEPLRSAPQALPESSVGSVARPASDSLTLSLDIRITDDLRDSSRPYGKQVLKRGGMWYTPFSGLWQSVWLEFVPPSYIHRLEMTTDLKEAVLTVDPPVNGTVTLQTGTFPLKDGRAVLAPTDPIPWTPETPKCYDFTVHTEDGDEFASYFTLRTIGISSAQTSGASDPSSQRTQNGLSQQDQSLPRILLNGQPIFLHGLLDQGYYSDGLSTPASPAVMRREIAAMKALGFNTLRKHIKLEPDLYYELCDRLGLMVIQDMVNNGEYRYIRDTVRPTFFSKSRREASLHRTETDRERFLSGMASTVSQLGSYGCIIGWTIFNEGWGQFDAKSCFDLLRRLDDTRIIDSASGWFVPAEYGGKPRGDRDSDYTDLTSVHNYFFKITADPRLLKLGRPLFLSEFGGFTWPEEGHLFNPDKAYGYKNMKSRKALAEEFRRKYLEEVIPAARAGLCGAIYTQVSDVEDEINGLMTYDREVTKLTPADTAGLAEALQAAVHP